MNEQQVHLKEVNTLINVDLATVFMLEESLSSLSSLKVTFTEVKCMIRMMYAAITKRKVVWGAKPPRR